VEGQNENTTQLARIGAIVDQRWNLKKDLQDSNKKDEKEDRDEEKSKEGPKENHGEVLGGTLASAFC